MDKDKIPQDFREALYMLLDKTAKMEPLTTETHWASRYPVAHRVPRRDCAL